MIVRDLLKALFSDSSSGLNAFVMVNGKPADSVRYEDGRLLIEQIPTIEPRRRMATQPLNSGSTPTSRSRPSAPKRRSSA